MEPNPIGLGELNDESAALLDATMSQWSRIRSDSERAWPRGPAISSS